nr:MAG TPA: hypothetical protein [Caudoviricetes sp.]
MLSASLNALICSSVKSSAIRTGTVFSFKNFAALNLVCPFTISPSIVATIGTLKPNSFIELATASTACSLFLGLFS